MIPQLKESIDWSNDVSIQHLSFYFSLDMDSTVKKGEDMDDNAETEIQKEAPTNDEELDAYDIKLKKQKSQDVRHLNDDDDQIEL